MFLRDHAFGGTYSAPAIFLNIFFLLFPLAESPTEFQSQETGDESRISRPKWKSRVIVARARVAHSKRDTVNVLV